MLLVASLPSNCNSDFLMLLHPWNKNVYLCMLARIRNVHIQCDYQS